MMKRLMENKWMIRIALMAGYSIPFAALSLHGDAAYGTMLFYVLMAAGFGILCFGVIKSKQFTVVIAGNVLSFASSYRALLHFYTEKWSWYFKPFTADTFLVLISAAAFFIQTVFVFRAYRSEHRK